MSELEELELELEEMWECSDIEEECPPDEELTELIAAESPDEDELDE